MLQVLNKIEEGVNSPRDSRFPEDTSHVCDYCGYRAKAKFLDKVLFNKPKDVPICRCGAMKGHHPNQDLKTGKRCEMFKPKDVIEKFVNRDYAKGLKPKDVCEYCKKEIEKMEPRHSRGKKLWHVDCLKPYLEKPKEVDDCIIFCNGCGKETHWDDDGLCSECGKLEHKEMDDDELAEALIQNKDTIAKAIVEEMKKEKKLR